MDFHQSVCVVLVLPVLTQLYLLYIYFVHFGINTKLLPKVVQYIQLLGQYPRF